MHVCVRERKRERDRQRERERKKEREHLLSPVAISCRYYCHIILILYFSLG